MGCACFMSSTSCALNLHNARAVGQQLTDKLLLKAGVQQTAGPAEATHQMISSRMLRGVLPSFFSVRNFIGPQPCCWKPLGGRRLMVTCTVLCNAAVARKAEASKARRSGAGRHLRADGPPSPLAPAEQPAERLLQGSWPSPSTFFVAAVLASCMRRAPMCWCLRWRPELVRQRYVARSADSHQQTAWGLPQTDSSHKDVRRSTG